MRVYGRIYDELGKVTWVEVDTDNRGFNDAVYVTALAQCLKLNLGESPFFANYGIPARQTIVQQVYPDYYLARTQQQYSPFFASLIISRQPASVSAKSGLAAPPTYRVAVVTHSGAKLPPITIPTSVPI